MIPSRLVAALALLCAGCALFDSETVCTLVGGESGLTVTFSNVSSPILRVEVNPRSIGTQPVYVADCTQMPYGCANGVFFPEYSAPGAVITLVTTSGSVSGSIALTYGTSHPNGPECEPHLRTATVLVDGRNGFVTQP